MNMLIFLLALAILILNIAIVVKFFGLCKNVQSLKDRFVSRDPEHADSTKNLVRYYRTIGRADEMYSRIVKSLYEGLLSCRPFDQRQKEIATGDIKKHKELCDILNRELPEELSSVEAFIRYNDSAEK